ncbi:efflux RND transporter periplasmic adaptor subunit [Acidomonas methanolica]|uniref:efflux RND transporter periplasmic adaptor subunit n=1 Tax=Acidomonas methanolica TaxID=437 RepID=UPI002119EF19|nr:efflux RND transporter periplasmic adaptor subunit [Acidomonas methanolica]MCQ9156789.1 efflux RND transporter periplasmic adaptor subunit [Acidomonas methanolica]
MIRIVHLWISLLLGCVLFLSPESPSCAQGSVQTVSTAVADHETWQDEFQAVGNLVAHWGTELAFQTSGLVSEIDFHSGQDVTAGTVLARLQLNDETGLLAQYQAQAASDEIIFNRNTKQYQAQAVSKAEVDRDRLTWQSDLGRAKAEQALINMKTLKAPFSGRLGVRQINPGQYLGPGTLVVTLQALDPIYTDFYVPQNKAAILHLGLPVDVTVDAFGGQHFAGDVTAITPQVNLQSRTILVRATLKNPDHTLLPGMFALVHLTYGAPRSFVTIPKTAVIFTTYGDTVWVVERGKDGKQMVAHQRAVTTGISRGDRIAIVAGLPVGTTVVSAGQTKLYENARVAVNNVIQPNASTDFHPAEE